MIIINNMQVDPISIKQANKGYLQNDIFKPVFQMAMSMATTGKNSIQEISISDYECVSKSYPEFFLCSFNE